MNNIVFRLSSEIDFFKNGKIAIDGVETEIFEEQSSYNAKVRVGTNASVVITPIEHGESRGPRSRTLCDTGYAKLKASPMGNNVHLEVILPRDMASARNFRFYASEVLNLADDMGINLKEA